MRSRLDSKLQMLAKMQARAQQLTHIEECGGHVTEEQLRWVTRNMQHYANEVERVLHNEVSELIAEVPGVKMNSKKPQYPFPNAYKY